MQWFAFTYQRRCRLEQAMRTTRSISGTGRRMLGSGPIRPRRGRERGAALVELALIMPVLAVIVLSSIDLGRTASFHNKMSNAAREGAGVAQFSPTAVSSGCNGDRNILDRVRKQSESLSGEPGYSVTVAKKSATTGALTPYTGCTTTTPALTFAPGDRVVVTVEIDVAMLGPMSMAFVGNSAHLERSAEVVVQG
jgi:Flp pilus assembly protein TadG